jgi:hypothetical protein
MNAEKGNKMEYKKGQKERNKLDQTEKLRRRGLS